ncbi:MAG: DUF1995 family protein [Synechococcales bacterium]|nr:DUF1995 family protein [Synechococcales bacterium]
MTPSSNSPISPQPDTLPNSLEEAIAQAQVATQAAIQAGYTRLSVELIFPELKPLPIAKIFAAAFEEQYGAGIKLFFTDAGTAAWVQGNWGDVPYRFGSIDVAGSRQTTTVEEQIAPDDTLYIFVAPTAVEIGPVEQICQAAGDRPVILFNPQLEDVAIVGIGYAARMLRDRFLKTIEPCYYLRSLDDTVALTRFYPTPWQIWLERSGNWQVIAEEGEKPDSERIDGILATVLGNKSTKTGWLTGLQQFLRALSR